MVFYLKVIGGADDGTSHRVENGDVVIGRAPTARVQLRDESIAWEHLVVRDTGTRLVVVNLAAAGTKVRGKRITEETRVASGEEIQISPKMKLVVESHAAAGPGGLSRTSLLLLLIVILLILGIGGAMLLSGDKQAQPVPMTAVHWRQAYMRIGDRMEKWVNENRLPPEAVTLYNDAWRFEQAGNYKMATTRWSQLQAALCGLRAPTGRGLSTDRFPEATGSDPRRTLGVVMGWDQSAASAQVDANADETIADALVWFVRKRLAETSKQVKE